MIQVRSALLQVSLDLQVDEQLYGEELLKVCLQWLQERYADHRIPSAAFLMRARDQRILAMNQTLKESEIENDELFYLF